MRGKKRIAALISWRPFTIFAYASTSDRRKTDFLYAQRRPSDRRGTSDKQSSGLRRFSAQVMAG